MYFFKNQKNIYHGHNSSLSELAIPQYLTAQCVKKIEHISLYLSLDIDMQ